MWKFLCALTVLFVSVRSFDYEEFQRKHCYLEENLRPTWYYFPYDFAWPKHLNGYVCENFVLTKDDLESMASKKFSLTDEHYVFLKNCEIEYLNEHLISKFQSIWNLYFENCKISLKNPENNLKPTISTGLGLIGFHKCEILDNKKSLAFQKLTDLRAIYVQNSTFEYPVIDEYFLRKKHDLYNFLLDNTNVKSFHKGLLSTETNYFNRISCTSCDLDEIDSLLYGIKYNITDFVSFADNSITKLPSSTNIFAKLPELNLSGNKIIESNLNRIHFKEMNSLRILDLSRNTKITAISYLAFKDTALQNLNMSRVNLESLEKLGSANFQTIDFSHNKISDIGSDVFEGLTKLTHLNISHNRISKLDGDVFKGLTKLTHLNISHNRISKLEGAVFESLGNLVELRLNFNFLKELQKDIFKGLTNLKFLDLSSNTIKTIRRFGILPSLQELILRNNSFSMIPSGGLFPSSLETLDISENNIAFLTQRTFSNLVNLASLDMSCTNDSKLILAKNTFQPLKALMILKMNNNLISDLNGVFFPPSLEELDLGCNKLEDIPAECFKDMVYLSSLDLSNNPIKILEILEKCPRIESILKFDL